MTLNFKQKGGKNVQTGTQIKRKVDIGQKFITGIREINRKRKEKEKV
jgi:hypothetical protein